MSVRRRQRRWGTRIGRLATCGLIGALPWISFLPAQAAQKETADPCQRGVDSPVVQTDLSYVETAPERRLLLKLKRLAADAYSREECVRSEELVDLDPLEFFVKAPLNEQLEHWIEMRAGPADRVSDVEFQWFGSTGSLDPGEGAPEIVSHRVAFPWDATTKLPALLQVLDRKGAEAEYALLEFVFVPRIVSLEPEEPRAESQSGGTYRIYPFSLVPSRLLDEREEDSSSEEAPPLIELRSWKQELERAGVEFIKIMLDDFQVLTKGLRLRSSDYSRQELRSFDLRLSHRLATQVYLDPEELTREKQAEFEYVSRFQRFWEEVERRRQSSGESGTEIARPELSF